MMLSLAVLLAVFLVRGSTEHAQSYSWTYRCDSSGQPVGGHYLGPRCEKVLLTTKQTVQGLNACKMTCGTHGLLWPKPTGIVQLSPELVSFLPQDLTIEPVSSDNEPAAQLLRAFAPIFKEYLLMKHPLYTGDGNSPFPDKTSVPTRRVQVMVNMRTSDTSLTTGTNESYSLLISTKAEETPIIVSIEAETYYGARHALETLSQMVAYNDATDTLLTYSSAQVTDQPMYVHRGLLIDTSRNYMTVATIKQIIAAMSYDKLNVFHWHITDTDSFPFVSTRVPQLALLGAYSPRKIYTPEVIRDVVEYARVRGVRVLPEFDAPAHVGNGWQFGEREGLGRLALCVNQEPWQDYCVEPPCGQLNPVNPNVSLVLGQLYRDMVEAFEPIDMFHMGGDEVNLNCWNSSQEVRDYLEAQGQVGLEEDLIQLWNRFQSEAKEKLYAATGKKVPVILWTSRLTEKGEVEQYLNKEDYIIQIWTTGQDALISELINKGYRVIFSNYDAWYLDCGYGGWVGAGNNWCSPYKGWQLAYDNSPRQIYREQGGDVANYQLILGGEAAMWSEQVDSASIIQKIWPRASAMAERLWTDPETTWKQAELRMVAHRQELLERGVQSDSLQPEWCLQNEGLCYVRI